MNDLADFRRFYAEFIVRSTGSSDERLIAAFAAVPREAFMGPGPWQVFVGSGYIPSLSDDPRLLYQDVLVGLAPDRKINNGQPSLHARCLAAVTPAEGEAVVHIGAGTGYYSALLAELVGSSGSVRAYEIEPDLAEAAARHLQPWPAVEVRAQSGVQGPLPMADIVYVSAGATRPAEPWLDALNPGGRLIFPLTADDGCGAMAMVSLLAAREYAVRLLMRVSFIDCIGARDAQEAVALAAAFKRRDSPRSLLRDGPPDGSAWCVGKGWWFSCREPGASRVS